MLLATLLLLADPAHAENGELEAKAMGYGVPSDGFPSLAERRLLLWTNAARVAPEAFEDLYEAGGCSTADFSEDELTPKAPLYLDLDLTEVARVQSTDMATNGCFQHESCDGTAFETRVAGYYDDTSMIGENIAMGSSDPKTSVMSMWMCSTSGHRANIMSGTWNELGPGVDGMYMTQDFGAGSLEQGDPPVRASVDDAGLFWADWGDDAPPAVLNVVVDGVETPLELVFGTETNGVYGTDAVELPEGGCTSWWTYWETADGRKGGYPAAGSWLVGDCTGAAEGDWTDVQPPRGGIFLGVPEDELHDAMIEDLELVGCAAVPGGRGAGWGVVTGLALLAIRRRR